MKKIDILKLNRSLKKAIILENKLALEISNLQNIIEESTGIIGNVDLLQGDGFGFTPESNNDTHVSISDIIKWAKQGEIITEELILSRIYF